jgi:hypothetical protein
MLFLCCLLLNPFSTLLTFAQLFKLVSNHSPHCVSNCVILTRIPHSCRHAFSVAPLHRGGLLPLRLPEHARSTRSGQHLPRVPSPAPGRGLEFQALPALGRPGVCYVAESISRAAVDPLPRRTRPFLASYRLPFPDDARPACDARGSMGSAAPASAWPWGSAWPDVASPMSEWITSTCCLPSSATAARPPFSSSTCFQLMTTAASIAGKQ